MTGRVGNWWDTDVDIFATGGLVVEFFGLEMDVVVNFGIVDGELILLVKICEAIIELDVVEAESDDMEPVEMEICVGSDERVFSLAADDVVEDDILLNGKNVITS